MDLDALRGPRGEIHPGRLRAALPPGWRPDADGVRAVRDGRIAFRESWVLLAGLVVFGLLGGAFLVGAMPRGLGGWLRLGGMLALLLLLGGIAGPAVTRALRRR